MSFFIASSPHVHSRKKTSDMMKWVLIAAIPGLLTQTYIFGFGTLIQLVIASVVGLFTEALVIKLRKRPVIATLKDNSALVSLWLLAVAIPPLSPWWLIAIGAFVAIVIAKQLYGGLGQNPFNPAMVAYVVLLVSFPVQMTSWIAPSGLFGVHGNVSDAVSVIFTGFNTDGLSLQQLRSGIDGITSATVLDSLKTAFHAGTSAKEAMTLPAVGNVGGLGWEWVNLAYLLGGLILLKKRVIYWFIPVGVLGGLLFMSLLFMLLSPETNASPFIHFFSGATMLGAFFIATDPVSAATTVKGRLIYGVFIGVMIYIIRTWGGFPDGVAFAVLLANMCVPLIDNLTKPRTYGYKR